MILPPLVFPENTIVAVVVAVVAADAAAAVVERVILFIWNENLSTTATITKSINHRKHQNN